MWAKNLKVPLFKWAPEGDIYTLNNNRPWLGVAVDVIDFNLTIKLGCAIEATISVQKENYVQKAYQERGWMYHRHTEMAKWEFLHQGY